MQESIAATTCHKQCTIAYKLKCLWWFGYGSYFFIMKSQVIVSNGVPHACTPQGGRHSNIILYHVYGVVVNLFNYSIYSRPVKMNKFNRQSSKESFDGAVFFPEG